MKKKVAILTYHAAHNYGSVLQAFATQVAIDSLGVKSTIINYRLNSQKKLYSITNSDKNNEPELYELEVKKLGSLFEKKVARFNKFEEFISKMMHLSEEFSEYEDALKELSRYSIGISGSDQILNLNTGELKLSKKGSIRPYILDVDNLKKISYATSLANTSNEQFLELLPFLQKFDYISVREKTWQSRIQQYVKTPVTNVLDPTFLLSKKDWIRLLKIKRLKNTKPYILVYTIYENVHTIPKLEILLNKIDKLDIDIHLIAPFAKAPLSYMSNKIVERLECGPKEFLEEILNATFIIPESFHGLALSINFNKPFVCPCGTSGPELRKIELLQKMGLSDRYRPNFWEITLDDIFTNMDYTETNKRIKKMRISSYRYLKYAIFGKN